MKRCCLVALGGWALAGWVACRTPQIQPIISAGVPRPCARNACFCPDICIGVYGKRHELGHIYPPMAHRGDPNWCRCT